MNPDDQQQPTQRSERHKVILAMHEWESQEKLLTDIEH